MEAVTPHLACPWPLAPASLLPEVIFARSAQCILLVLLLQSATPITAGTRLSPSPELAV